MTEKKELELCQACGKPIYAGGQVYVVEHLHIVHTHCLGNYVGAEEMTIEEALGEEDRDEPML